MFCCTLLYVHSRFAIILMGKKELVVLLGLSSWCLVIVVWLFLTVPWVCLGFVIVVFSDPTHLLFYINLDYFIFPNIAGSDEKQYFPAFNLGFCCQSIPFKRSNIQRVKYRGQGQGTHSIIENMKGE